MAACVSGCGVCVLGAVQRATMHLLLNTFYVFNKRVHLLVKKEF